MGENESKWYVLKVVTGGEKKVKQMIESDVVALKLQDYINRVLVPTEKVYQVRNGKKITKERNFYPGYVFVDAILVGEVPHVLRNIPGVLGFLGNKNEPIPLRQFEVIRMLGKVDELLEQGEDYTAPFIIGESVKVVDGPFNSFSGVIEEINNDKKKLKVTVKIFGRKTPLELGFMQVEKEA